MAFVVYTLTNTVSGKVYVGKTKDLKTRIRRHWNYAAHGSKVVLHAAMRKYGREAFRLDVIGTYPSDTECLLAEVKAIAAMGTKVWPNKQFSI